MAEETPPQPRSDNDEDTTAILNTVRTLLTSLETLQSIETYEIAIPGVAQRWQETTKAGEQALNELQELMEEWQIEFERHYHRAEDTLDALGLLDEDETAEEEKEESHE